MSAIKSGDTQRFISAGGRGAAIILVYGPDEGLVRTRIRALADAILGQDADAMSRVDFEAETLNADPPRLLDEANAMSMFGGKRVIIVSAAGRLSKSAWQPLLEVPPIDSTILLLADDLAKSSPLRAAVEASTAAAAIACYPPTTSEMLDGIDTQITRAGLSITPAARAALGELLGADFALAQGEVEKLLLYCQGKLTIELDDIEACVVDSSEAAGHATVDCAFDGQLPEIERAAQRSFREGINPSGLLALSLNHAFLLRRLAEASANRMLDQAMRSERVFFRRQDRVRLQAQRWDTARLARIIDTLTIAQEASRRSASLTEAIVIRALWSVAIAARRR